MVTGSTAQKKHQEKKHMKTNVNLVTLALLGMVVILALNAWQPRAAVSAAPTPAAGEADCATGRTVQVSGAAVINVVPDRALIQLGVQSNGEDPQLVRAMNAQAIQRVIAAVRALGVEAKHIATDAYLVYPVYQDYNALSIKGYRIDNVVSITLVDISLADDVLLAALKAGANEVQDVQFYTSELRKHRDQARELAVKAANEKAQALASAAGAQAGCVLTLTENSWYQYYGSWRGGRDTALWAQNTIQNAAPSQGASSSGAPADSPITLGQIAVRAEVSASYSLK
jgi:uncharacterized protein YggE